MSFDLKEFNQRMEERRNTPIEIDRDNVQDLWELYEEARTEYKKRNPFKEYYQNFEDYVTNDVFICGNCDQYTDEEHKGWSELALHDNICEWCMEDGYGK